MDYRIAKDKIAGQVMFIMTITSILLVIAMTIGLFIKSEPILSQYHLWDLLTESNWRPMEGKFGFLPFLAGTFWCTVLAIWCLGILADSTFQFKICSSTLH